MDDAPVVVLRLGLALSLGPGDPMLIGYREGRFNVGFIKAPVAKFFGKKSG
jgi:hypothetical protein